MTTKEKQALELIINYLKEKSKQIRILYDKTEVHKLMLSKSHLDSCITYLQEIK